MRKFQVPVLLEVQVDDDAASESVELALEGLTFEGALRIMPAGTLLAAPRMLQAITDALTVK